MKPDILGIARRLTRPMSLRRAAKLSPSKAVVRNFLATFAFVKSGGVGDLSRLSGSQEGALMQELGWRALVRGRDDMVAASTPESWFNVSLNGVHVVLPRYTLMTMRHCITASVNGKVELSVEIAHWETLRRQLTANTLFLDIGAATGAMSLPFAMGAPQGTRIVAFEPSRRARDYLEATLSRNNVEAVTVLPYALSNQVGEVEFIELPEDASGVTPYLPEGSRLAIEHEINFFEGQKIYAVEVTTLDSLRERLAVQDGEKVVVKIDVEGFEDKVLMGAREILGRYRPFLSIDIHYHPGSTIQTDQACAAILTPLGYKIDRVGHVMLAAVA